MKKQHSNYFHNGSRLKKLNMVQSSSPYDFNKAHMNLHKLVVTYSTFVASVWITINTITAVLMQIKALLIP